VLLALLSAVGATLVGIGQSQAAWAAGASIAGTGSSFASPAITQWQDDVSHSPYGLTINWTPSNSGQGRYEFTNQTVDFAVSDTGYVSASVGTTPPSFPFIFIPITAAGVAFMYNIPGLKGTLQLTSYEACAILTGGITNWDQLNNSSYGAQASGVTLPNLPIIPVTESDPAGTNYVLEEWCIAEQPSLWANFAHQQETQSGGPTDGVAINATSPSSNWPGIRGGLDEQNTTSVAGGVQSNSGAIGAVQLQYALDDGYGKGNPAEGVASVENASGDYTQPSPPDVASALAYATQLANGTHQLNFNGLGPHVYNPSTYSYLLTPTTGWSKTKGATLSAFVDYVLTLGQKEAPNIQYASLGLSLERYGVDAVTADVPGAVAVTSAENSAYSCGDLTPTEVAAGQTTPTCGVTTASAPVPPADGGASGTSVASTTGSSNSSSAANTAGVSSSSSGASGSDGSGGTSALPETGSADPSVSLGSSTPLAFTGVDPLPLGAAGVLLAVGGWIIRRRLIRNLAMRRAQS
jgi:ABC-type phosphate transport system substrate-binding protein